MLFRSTEELQTTRAEIAQIAGVDSSEVAYNAIGASWGKEISRQGVIALLVFTVLVMLLIAVYFRDWKMSIAAIVAVVHDLLLTIGTSGLVYPAAGLPVLARRLGKPVIVINPDETEHDRLATLILIRISSVSDLAYSTNRSK